MKRGVSYRLAAAGLIESAQFYEERRARLGGSCSSSPRGLMTWSLGSE